MVSCLKSCEIFMSNLSILIKNKQITQMQDKTLQINF